MASRSMKDRSIQPPSFHSLMCASRNCLLKAKSQKNKMYLTTSIQSLTLFPAA